MHVLMMQRKNKLMVNDLKFKINVQEIKQYMRIVA
jgi:hypothetical protein